MTTKHRLPGGQKGSSAAALPVAFLLRGLDGFFLQPPEGVQLFALVPADTELASFAQRCWPAATLLPFRCKKESGPYPTTEELLRSSDIAAVLRRHGIGALLLSCACSAGIAEWSQRHGIRLLMTEYAEQRRLEDKIWFHRFLQRLRLPSPQGGSFRLGRDPLPVRGPAVLQIADSMGGEGTFFVGSAQDVAQLEEKGIVVPGQRYLLRRLIRGRPFGITVFVGPRDIILSALRLQCYYPAGADAARRAFAGIQWLPSAQLSPRLRPRLNQTFLSLGRALHRRRALGFANIDFMVDEQERIFILECNARMSAATPQLLSHPQLSSGQDLGLHFLQRFRTPPRCVNSPTEWPLPDSDFAGATLDLLVPGPTRPDRSPAALRLRRAYRSGRYRARDGGFAFLGPYARPLPSTNEISLFFFAQRGQSCAEEDTLATVLTGGPLFDAQGGMLPLAQQILSYFQPTRGSRHVRTARLS